MTICGKPVRLIGKIASGNFSHCTRTAGHEGDCSDKEVRAVEGAGKTRAAEPEIVIGPNWGWPYGAKQAGDDDEQAGDSTLPPILPEIPDGVVIQ